MMMPVGCCRIARCGHRLHLRVAGIALLTLVILVVAGCGVSGTGGTSGSLHGTLQGKIVASPTCPVERVGHPCQPAPVADRAVSIETKSGTVVASVTTSAQGEFSAILDPGVYAVKVAFVAVQVGLRQLTPGDVTIIAGQVTSIAITLDTGIR